MLPSCLEINLLQASSTPADTVGLGTFMVKHGIPALVVDNMFVEQAMYERARFNGRYKIICAVDFPLGRKFAMEKMRDIPRAALAADGFEILLSANHQEKDIFNEMKSIHAFIKNIDQLKEVRWVFGFRSRTHEQMQPIMQYLPQCPASFVRTDVNVTIPDAGDLTDIHLKDIEFIRRHIGAQIKVSGECTHKMIKALHNKATRFDVSPRQAKDFVRQLELADQEQILDETNDFGIWFIHLKAIAVDEFGFTKEAVETFQEETMKEKFKSGMTPYEALSSEVEEAGE